MTLLALRDVTLSRAGRTLVAGLNLDARPGDLIALRGPSGCGKTTILRAIAGLDPFERGTISVGDARLEGGASLNRATLHRLRRSVGLVFQFHCLFEHMSALQNVCLAPRHVYRVAPEAAERAARDLLRQLGVESRARRVTARAVGRRSAESGHRASVGGESTGPADGRADGVARRVAARRARRAPAEADGVWKDAARHHP